eukprot:7020620-Pyramimonas_sp.AAC.1
MPLGTPRKPKWNRHSNCYDRNSQRSLKDSSRIIGIGRGFQMSPLGIPQESSQGPQESLRSLQSQESGRNPSGIHQKPTGISQESLKHLASIPKNPTGILQESLRSGCEYPRNHISGSPGESSRNP